MLKQKSQKKKLTSDPFVSNTPNSLCHSPGLNILEISVSCCFLRVRTFVFSRTIKPEPGKEHRGSRRGDLVRKLQLGRAGPCTEFATALKVKKGKWLKTNIPPLPSPSHESS